MSPSAFKLTFSVILICFFVDSSNSTFVDTLTKCGIKEPKCQSRLFESVLQRIGKTGIPDLNIPPIDPIQIKDVSFEVMNWINLTFVEGVVTGIKDCKFINYDIDIEKGTGSQELLCDVLIKGRYHVDAASPEIAVILGDSELVGDGQGKVKIDKIRLVFEYPVGVYKKADGEIYLKCDYSKKAQRFNILGKVTFAADNIYLGKENVSEIVVNYLNDNWKFIMKTFGRIFIDKATEYYNLFARNFFDHVPAKHFISDDLSPYL